MKNIQSQESTKTRYYQVSTLKFCLMSLCTLGIYQVYWFYQNWKYIKERDSSDIMPFWRALFGMLWYYFLLDDLAKNHKTKNLSSYSYKVSLAVSYFFLNFLTVILPDPFWLIAIISFLILIPAIWVIATINPSDTLVKRPKSDHTSWNYLTYLLGGAFLILIVLSTINYFPSTMVIKGSLLWDRDINYLQQQKLLQKDEQILYFYSTEPWSIKNDGQFITNKGVTSYWRESENSEVEHNISSYNEIKDISVEWSDTFLEDTVITVVNHDESTFGLWLSTENKGDRLFVDELNKRLEKAKQ